MSQNHKSALEGRILPGYKPVMELLSEQPENIAKIYCLKNPRFMNTVASICRKQGIALEYVDASRLDAICADADRNIAHQGIAALLSEARIVSFEQLLEGINKAPLPLILALDQIQDPGNLGTLCRTAWCLGVCGMLVPKHNSSSLGPAALRSSAGALEKMPIAMATNLGRALDAAEEKGITIYGTGHMAASGKLCSSAFAMRWELPAILVLGNENRGIRPGVAKRCGIFIDIPFARKFDSLNIAQAGAILLGLCSTQYISQ